MIDIRQDYNVVRTLFLDECKKRNIPTNNKAIALYRMAEKLDADPDDEALRELLFLTLADDELFISQFGGYNSYEVEEIYQEIRETYESFWRTYKEQANLEDTFFDYQSSEEEIIFGGAAEPVQKQTEEMAEACTVVELARACLKLGDETEDYLFANVSTLLYAIHQDPFLERCKPLILFLAISRYETEFVHKSQFQICIKDLFTGIDYPIDDADKKRRKKYKALTKFYRKLYKLYKKDEKVDRKQCRYGFFATSNLINFVVNEQIDKCKMHCPPFLYMLLFTDMSCLEADQPDAWSDETLFDLTEEQQEQYYDLDEKDAGDYFDEKIDLQVAAYLKTHTDVLVELMQAIYLDKQKVVNLVKDVYQNCVQKPTGEFAKYENALQAEVYFEMQYALERIVEEKVIQICMR